jgi:ribosome-binding ATPase
MLKVGIIGLAQAGKTTLFRIMTRAHGTGVGTGRAEAHLGVVAVPDPRLDRLTAMFNPRKKVHATVEYVDSPGSVIDLVRAGSESALLREVQALAHVVRAFGDDSDLASSLRHDIETVELELILSDLAVAEKRLQRLEKDIKKQKNPSLEHELQVLALCKGTLEKQTPLRELSLDTEQARVIRGFTFLSEKPLLYVLNLDERDAGRTNTAGEELASAAGLKQHSRTGFTAVCGKVESELAELTDQEAAEFMASFGLREPAVDRVIRSSYQLLGLISFFTVGEDECRAWTIRSGASAWEAAGEIHTDIQRGFIRAEVVAYGDLIACGSLAEARNRGRLRLEGKDYVVKDGEIVHFRHSG